MTFEEFDAITETLLAQIRQMRDTKGREYAGPRDRFDNFNRLSTRMGIRRQQVWQVYFTKHIDAIESFIREERTYSSEGIEGRIVDAMVYLLLLAGMIREDSPTPASPHTPGSSTASPPPLR
jgi:hypothetical protein